MISEEDEAILTRWKGNGLSVYRESLPDYLYEHVFVCGPVIHRTASTGGHPVFTQDDRDFLTLCMDDHERALTS